MLSFMRVLAYVFLALLQQREPCEKNSQIALINSYANTWYTSVIFWLCFKNQSRINNT